MIDTYRAYTDEQIRDRPEGGVTLDMLLEAVAAPTLADDVRRRAAETIYMDRAVTSDPALDMNGRKPREKRNRVQFSARVEALLRDGDALYRTLGEEIFAGLWTGWKKR